MKRLRVWLDEAKAAGSEKGLHLLPLRGVLSLGLSDGSLKPRIPTRRLPSYAKDLDILVFNGHVHTTEQYEVEGVKLLLMGGRGR